MSHVVMVLGPAGHCQLIVPGSWINIMLSGSTVIACKVLKYEVSAEVGIQASEYCAVNRRKGTECLVR